MWSCYFASRGSDFSLQDDKDATNKQSSLEYSCMFEQAMRFYWALKLLVIADWMNETLVVQYVRFYFKLIE